MSDARDAEERSDFIGGLLSFSPAREANYVSGVYQQLGRTRDAVALADDALRMAVMAPTRSYATEAQIRLNQVEALLDAVDLDAASAALAPVLALPAELRLSALTTRVSRFRPYVAEAAKANHPLARQLQGDIAAFADHAATG